MSVALRRRAPLAALRVLRPASRHLALSGAAHRLLSTHASPPPPPPPPPAAAAATSSTLPIVEVRSPQDFDDLCVRASATPPPVGGPVILDLYADWGGPCKQLTPKLEALVTAAGGTVRLAKVNVDNLPEIAQALQVASLPTVMLLHGGKIVDSFKGPPLARELAGPRAGVGCDAAVL